MRDAARLKREAEEYERAGRPERAAPLYRHILDQKPDSPEILNRLGDLEDRFGRVAEAAAAWARSAEVYEQDGLIARAMSLWKKVLRRSPSHLIARLHLAQLHLQQGLLREAHTQFLAVALDAPVQQNHLLAAEALEALIRLDSGDLSLRVRLAQAYADMGARERALGTLQSAIDHLSVEGRLSDTLPLIHKGLEIEPDHAEFLEALAEIDRLLEAFPPEVAEPDVVLLVERVDAETLVPREEPALFPPTGVPSTETHLAATEASATEASATEASASEASATEAVVTEAASTEAPAPDALEDASAPRPAAEMRPESIADVPPAETGEAAADRTAPEAVVDAARSETSQAPAASTAAEAQPAQGLVGSVTKPQVEPLDIEPRLAQAASEIRSATALLFTSGTGIGLDAGLPDYRDGESFWKDHPAYQGRGVRFEDLARPALFERDPALAWGFFGRRRDAARHARPHDGLTALVRWRDGASEGAFVATCSVEGLFERAGFAAGQVMDCYGRIDRLQCSRKCGVGLFPIDEHDFGVDEETLLAHEPFPRCPSCGALARPNVLLFGDLAWDRSRLAEQERQLHDWLEHARTRRGRHLVVVECGDVPPVSTARSLALKLVADLGAVFVSIKPRGGAAPEDAIVLPLGIRDALLRIDRYLRAK